MSLFTWFERKGNKVVLDIDSDLATNISVYPFDWSCADENYAELLKEQFNAELIKYKTEISRDCIIHLPNHEVSKLKAQLRGWDGRKHCWKR